MGTTITSQSFRTVSAANHRVSWSFFRQMKGADLKPKGRLAAVTDDPTITEWDIACLLAFVIPAEDINKLGRPAVTQIRASVLFSWDDVDLIG
jgi:hypothetical protein